MSRNKKVTNNKSEVSKRKRLYQYLAVIFLFSFFLYGNTISNDYSLDDVYVTNNEVVQKGLSAIPGIFTTLYARVYEDGEELNFGYRPIVKATFAIEYEFFGNNPHVSHFLNILLYAFACMMVFLILKRLFLNAHVIFPLIITLLFLTHPIHTEVVSSLKNRDELLSFIGIMLAMYYFLKFADHGKIKHFLIALFFYLFAFLSKFTTLTFLAICPLILYFFSEIKPRKIIFIALSILVIIAVVRLGPKLYLPPKSRITLFVENPLIFETDIWLRISTGFYILLYYIRMLVFPHPLSFYYGYNMIPVVNFINFFVILSILFHFGIFFYALFKFRKRNLLSFIIFFYLISISIFSNFIKPTTGIIAERFLFLPSLGFAILIGYVIFKFLGINLKENIISKNKMTKIFVILVIIFIPYSVKTINRNKQWKDQLTLMSNDMKHLRNSAKANYIYAGNLKTAVYTEVKETGRLFKNKKNVKVIIKHLKQAIEVYPDYYQAWNMLGEIYITLKLDYKSSISCFETAIDIYPDFIPAYNNLVFVYKSQKNYDKAIECCKHAIELNPTDKKALTNLANLYLEINDSVNAEYFFNKANEQINTKARRRRRSIF